MNEREQFEAFASGAGKWPKAIERDSKGEYRLAQTASDWRVWQARAALAASPVPAEIMAIADRLRTQDNRITDNPLFAVQQKREYVGSENYNDAEAKWVDEEGREADDDETSRLDAEYAQTYAEPEGWRRVHVFHVWEFVTGCLTEQGCKDYIARNGHNLREPRIYAYGSYRNAEWIALRKWLMSLPAAPTMLNGLTESAASVSAPAQQNKTALMPEEEAALKRALHRSVTLLPAAPAPSVEAQADRLRQPAPDDLLTVANVELDGNTLSLLLSDLGALEAYVGEGERTYALHITTMRRDEFEALGEFNGF